MVMCACTGACHRPPYRCVANDMGLNGFTSLPQNTSQPQWPYSQQWPQQGLGGSTLSDYDIQRIADAVVQRLRSSMHPSPVVNARDYDWSR